MSDDATPTTTGGDVDAKLAALEQRLAAYERAQAAVFSLPGPRTDLPERWGPRVRIGLVEEGRYMGEVLTETGGSHGFPKLIGEPFMWLNGTRPPLSRWMDGTDYGEDEYPELFAAIGNTFDTYRGAADPGAGRFRVPDWTGLVVVGFEAGDAFFGNLATQGGSASGGGGGSDHTHTFSDTHNHGPGTSPPHRITSQGTAQAFTSGSSITVATAWANASLADATVSGTTSLDGGGGGGAGTNLQPYAVAYWAIFAGR